jgi:hypothetical protein
MAACLQIAGLKRADYLFRVPLVGARTAGTAMCMLTHDGAVSLIAALTGGGRCRAGFLAGELSGGGRGRQSGDGKLSA